MSEKKKNKTKMKLIIVLPVLAMLIVPGLSLASGPSALINVHVTSYDSFYGLYIYAPQKTTAPMLKNFQVSIVSPGNSSFTINMGGANVAYGSFSYSTVINMTVGGNQTQSMIVTVQSSQTGQNRTFFYFLEFMTAVEFIAYENGKLHPQSVGYTNVDMIAAAGAGISTTLVLFRLGLPFWRNRIRRARIKMGAQKLV
ncbi:MAG: hypothetical protein ACYDAO_09980 [Thermoplasmataceae archaeon]